MAGISCGFMPLGGGSGKDWEKKLALDTVCKIFSELDTDCDGFIKVDAFVTFLALRNIEVTPEDLDKLKDMMNESGEIRKIDVQRHAVDSKYFEDVKKRSWELCSEIDSTNTMFKVLDKDGDGYLTKKDFSQSLRNLRQVIIIKQYF